MDKKGLHVYAVNFLFVLYDIITVNAAYLLALWLRFDCQFNRIRSIYLNAWKAFTPWYTVLCLAVFILLRMYRSLWRYAGYTELYRILLSSVITGTAHIVLTVLFFIRMPLTYYCLGMILQFFAIVLSRFGYRFGTAFQMYLQGGDGITRLMLVGAGDAGQMILRDIARAKDIHEKVVCIIDDNPAKIGRFVEGVPIVGNRNDIPGAVEEYGIEKIYLAIPGARAEDRRDIINICNRTGCELRQLPGIRELINYNVTIRDMQDVKVEDLLGREPIQTDLGEVFDLINGKVVLVTGGGGSIGSELCRQISAHSPKQLIILDIYENSAYDIQMELKERYPDLNLVTVIGSVRDSRKVFQVFETYRPQLVYHAAAHKHVPLMEDSPCEAIKNNTIGTYKTAYAAMLHGCERFVLISTDKAVNPTNIMGASKRLCEMVVQSFDQRIKEGKVDEIPQLFTHRGFERADKDGSGRIFRDVHTEFVAVRFGNVLGSNGSVIPIFKKQIEKGGPVTVTHPDIIRYFMTIPEAVSLVLMAGVYAKGGEIFVLDMGSPMKIDDLARNLIRLSGYKPDVDIPIIYTGLRPGEKLYEEKLMAEEGLMKTKNELIHIGKPVPFNVNMFFLQLSGLMNAAYQNNQNIRSYVEKMVSTYHPEKGSGTNEM